jgi:hypothetical protein
MTESLVVLYQYLLLSWVVTPETLAELQASLFIPLNDGHFVWMDINVMEN